MARTAIPVTSITRAGVAPPAQTNASAANKHTLANGDSRTILEVVSTDAADQTVAFELSGIDANLLDGVTTPSKSVTIPAGATRLLGPFPKSIYGASVLVDPSVSTTLKFRAYSW